MDLYRIDSSLNKGYSEKSSHFTRSDSTQSGARNDLTKFANNDLLSSSSWSSVIHQPAPDSEPEDLPSTVDIDAIKQPPTPVNASAQTPARQLHGDNNSSFDLSDDHNAADSGSESESDSESCNSENEVENTASGNESASSESDSASSCPSSTSSKDKQPWSRSSRSNTPPSNSEDRQQFSVRETNLEQGGLKMKLSTLNAAKFGRKLYDDNSSDSAESKDGINIKPVEYAVRKPSPRKHHILSSQSENKLKNTSYKLGGRCELPEANYDDSDSSSSSLTSPAKRYMSLKSKQHKLGRQNLKVENSANHSRKMTESDWSYARAKKEKYEKMANAFSNFRKDHIGNTNKEHSSQQSPSHREYRVAPSMFSPSVLKLPQTCKLSEDSDDCDEVPQVNYKNDQRKVNSHETLEKLAQHLTRPGNSTDHLQVLNEDDLAAVLPEVVRRDNVSAELDMTESSSPCKKGTSVYNHKKMAALSDSSSDAEMMPKQNQIVCDAINSIQVDSDESDNDQDSSTRLDSSNDSSSSEEEREKSNDKIQYNSNLLEVFAEKTEQLSKHNSSKKIEPKNIVAMSSTKTQSSVGRNTKPVETCRKRGRPPKSKISSMAEIESYIRLDCTVSNVSPDSGIQSNSGSPLYSIQSPARSVNGHSKKSSTSANVKSLSLSQKALLGASKKNSQKKKNTPADAEASNTSRDSSLLKPLNPEMEKKKSTVLKDIAQNVKTQKSAVASDEHDLIKVPPYLGSRGLNTFNSNPDVDGNLALFQGKRGPGRPKKHVLTKVNGKVNFDKGFPAKVDTQFNKSFELAAKPMFASGAKSKKQKYHRPVVMCLENPKKRRKKKNDLVVVNKKRSNAAPSASIIKIQKKFLKKRKKQKKNSKEKVVNVEILRELENLADIFNKKCVIEEKKPASKSNVPSSHCDIIRQKTQHRSKDRNCKKRKQSDRDSESETNSIAAVATSDTKLKRRHKKNSIETPKAPQNNCDQRLPLKKRHYHISASSVANNNHHHHHHHHHQSHQKTKVRNENDGSKSSLKSPDPTKIRPPLSPKVKSSAGVSSTSAGVTVSVAAAATTTTAMTITTSTVATLAIAAGAEESTPPTLEKCRKQSEVANIISPLSPVLRITLDPALPSVLMNKMQTVSSPSQPQLITPLPSDPTTSTSSSPGTKPPAGVFEPTRKLALSAVSCKGKKNIDDVLCKLNERLKNTSAIIEKLGSYKKETSENVGRPERTLRSKRASTEKENINVKKSKLTTTVTVRLRKLSNSELASSSNNSSIASNTRKAAVVTCASSSTTVSSSDAIETSVTTATVTTASATSATTIAAVIPAPPSPHPTEKGTTEDGTDKDEEKPKLKRRKIRNRTGFPVKKRRKLRKAINPFEKNAVLAIDEQKAVKSEDSSTLVIKETPVEEDCPPIVKNESIPVELDNWSDDDIPLARRRAPVLQPIENATVLVKNESIKQEEEKMIKSSTKNIPIATTTTTPTTAEKSKNMSSFNKTTHIPCRTSVRIHIKKQLQDEEDGAAKKFVEEKNAVEAKKLPAKEKEHQKRESRAKPVTDKQLPVPKIEEPQKIADKKESKSKTVNETEIKVNEDVDKECKSKEETDKEELSDDSTKQISAKKDTAPKRRKRFLHAGLFSDFYKGDKQPVVDWKNRYAPFNPKEHPLGLLPSPPYVEDWVRRRLVDFALPYDLWWLHQHDQLPGRAVVESWKYKKIMKNAYNEVKPSMVYETQACNCEIPKEEDKLGCGDDCINRLVYAECSPALCRLKERCSNQRIQKNSGDKKLIQFMTADKGIGIKSEKPVTCGEYIIEYVGEVVTDKEFKNRMTSMYKNDIHHYCLNLDGGLVIDGHRSGSDARFVNHSCEPNCEMQKWNVDGLYRMALFALRDIDAGEEITYDYNFALFNPEEGQTCRCGSINCRGVIGGKSQRVSISNAITIPTGDVTSTATSAQGTASNTSKKKSKIKPRKKIRKDNIPSKNSENVQNQRRRDSESSTNGMGMLSLRSIQLLTPRKPLSPEEIQVVKEYRIFLLRNLIKVQRFREKLAKDNSDSSSQDSNKIKNEKSKQSVEFLVQLNALSKERSIRTRGLAQVEDNPEMTKNLQLAKILRTMYNDIVSAKDERDEKNKPYSYFFLTLPSKRKLPNYYKRIEEPIDLAAVEKNIVTGVYKDVESFDADLNKLIMNNVTFYGRISDYGIAAVNLRKAYNIAKLKYAGELEEVLGQPLPPSFMPEQNDPGDEEEDVIRCICGLFNDEGLMIQCERCLVWQHCDCVRADTNVEDYLCERCNPREVDYDIPLDIEPPDYPKPEEKHYLTLVRDNLQIKQGDAVYVLRSIPNPETGGSHTFRTIQAFNYEDCDIFRVEQLWKTENGERFSFGHHYLRPHETFHEPTRKFYPNEVLKVPLYETVPLDLIMGRCHVLDPNTFCKGKPIDADPQHIYICEYRVDKEAKLFYKIPKSKQLSVCMKNYAFEKYDVRLKLSRTYAPHGDPKPTIASNSADVNVSTSKSIANQKAKSLKCKEAAVTPHQKHNKMKDSVPSTADSNQLTDGVKAEKFEVPLVKNPIVEKRKQQLDSILLKLLAKKSTRGALDVSYLLDMGRRNRKKPVLQTPVAPTQN